LPVSFDVRSEILTAIAAINHIKWFFEPKMSVLLKGKSTKREGTERTSTTRFEFPAFPTLFTFSFTPVQIKIKETHGSK
jgi:hypothetical protein